MIEQGGHKAGQKEKPELILICRVSPNFDSIEQVDTSLQHTLQASVDYFDFCRATLMLLRDGKVPVCWHASRNKEGPESGAAVHSERCIHLNEYLSDPENRDRKKLLDPLLPVISTNLPVFLKAGDPVGTMEIGIFNTDYQTGEYMLAKAASLGRHMADIIQESVFQRQKDRNLRKLSVWLEMVNTISSTLDIRQVLHVVAQLTADLFVAKSCIYLLDDEDQSLIPTVAVGSYDPVLKSKFKALKGRKAFPAIQKAIKAEQPVVVTPQNSERMLTREIVEQFNYGWVALAPIMTKGKTIGIMQVDRPPEAEGFDSEEVEIIFAIARATAVAIENARLIDMLGQKEQLLHQLVNKLITAQEDERKFIAADLHDGIIQSLIAIWYRLQRLSAVEEMEPGKWQGEITELTGILNEQIQEIRRILYDLRPIVLDNYGLIPAVEAHVNNISEKHALPVDLKVTGEQQRLDSKTEVALFRILQEALTNVIKHAAASSVKVSLTIGEENVILIVEDDGSGINKDYDDQTEPKHRLGLAGIQERALLLGGDCKIKSRPGKGTKIKVSIPFKTTPREEPGT